MPHGRPETTGPTTVYPINNNDLVEITVDPNLYTQPMFSNPINTNDEATKMILEWTANFVQLESVERGLTKAKFNAFLNLRSLVDAYRKKVNKDVDDQTLILKNGDRVDWYVYRCFCKENNSNSSINRDRIAKLYRAGVRAGVLAAVPGLLQEIFDGMVINASDLERATDKQWNLVESAIKQKGQ
jgi:hypothetical protein